MPTNNKKGILLVNLGSPDSTQTKDVKKYLKEFLSDKNVIDVWFFRKIILHLIILPFRSPKSAEAYQKIWWKGGSPLIVLTQRLLDKFRLKTTLPVEMGMRYGNPSIKSGLEKLKKQGCENILVVPLYPQYAMSTTETVAEKTMEVQKEFFPDLNIDYLKPFYSNPAYIKVLADSIQKELPADIDRLIFSYHGVPVRHITMKDSDIRKKTKLDYFGYPPTDEETNYQKHCYKTTALVQEQLGLGDDKILTAFQSRLGLDPWLQPYFAKTITELPQQGIKKIAVVTPAFVSDCLETLEEIAMEGKEEFLEAGGETYQHIPCLNDDDQWVEVMKTLCETDFDGFYKG